MALPMLGRSSNRLTCVWAAFTITSVSVPGQNGRVISSPYCRHQSVKAKKDATSDSIERSQDIGALQIDRQAIAAHLIEKRPTGFNDCKSGQKYDELR